MGSLIETNDELEIIESTFIDKAYVSENTMFFSKRYQKIASILPENITYKSAARVYSSGLTFFLHTDPNWCKNLASLKNLRNNPHVKRGEDLERMCLRHSELIITEESQAEYFKIMESKGINRGCSFGLSSGNYLDGVFLGGDNFLRERQLQDKFEPEVKRVIMELGKVFDLIEKEYRLKRFSIIQNDDSIASEKKYSCNAKGKIFLMSEKPILIT